MKAFAAVLAAAALLSGCESVQGAFVRQWHMDRALSNEMSTAIKEGLEKKLSAPRPAPELPRRPAPAFLDQG